MSSTRCGATPTRTTTALRAAAVLPAVAAAVVAVLVAVWAPTPAAAGARPFRA